MRRMLKIWWSLTAVVVVVGVSAVAPGIAGAQKDAPRLTVDRVDASGSDVVVDGWMTGGEPADLELTVGGETVTPTVVGPLGEVGGRNDVVVVIDNAESIGNAPVQLAKDAAAKSLLPGGGSTTTLGVISTGGRVDVRAGASSDDAALLRAIDGIGPSGQSLTWDGVTRAAGLLENRPEGSVGTVVLFAGSPSSLSGTPSSTALAALRQAGARLDVVAMEQGTDLTALDRMVGAMGGSMRILTSDEEIDEAFEGVAAELGGRFRLAFPAGDDSGSVLPLTLSVGGTTTQVGFTPGAVRSGAVDLAPVVSGGGSGGFLASPLVKWFALLLGVGAVVLVVWTVAAMVLPSENDLGSRLEVYEESYGAETIPDYDPDEGAQATVPIIRRAVELTGEMADRRGLLDKVEMKLERANLPLRAAEAMFFTAAATAILSILVFVVTQNVLVALLVGAAAVVIPIAVLNFKIRARSKAFVRQLPDMLSLLAGTLKAGYSVGQGFESVSTEISDPMGRELRRVVTETRLGRSLEESLDSVAERMDSDDFKWTVMAIRIQREVGGNLAELLMTVAETMTQRERLRRDVSTLTAEGRISAVIIGLLPPGLAAVLMVMNPAYISELFQPGLGYALLFAAVVMMGIGFAWMKKCITIEV